VVLGRPVEGSAIEEVKAWLINIGVRGDILLNSKWRLYYSGSYFEPISSEVENNNLPKWEVTDIGGYTFEFEGLAEYTYSESMSFALTLFGAQVHWKGSEWAPYASRSIKWPENDTRYLGCMLNVRWSF
jgi:hypothetical protein